MSTGTSFSYSLNQDTFKKWFGGRDGNGADDAGDEDIENQLPDDGTMGTNPYEEGPRGGMFDNADDTMGEFDEDGYLKNGINWNLSFNYSLRYGYGEFDTERLEYEGRLTHNFGLSGSIQPTKNWNFTFNTDYNFDQKKFTSINCTLTRNLHCWSMSASFIPINFLKSYNFTIHCSPCCRPEIRATQLHTIEEWIGIDHTPYPCPSAFSSSRLTSLPPDWTGSSQNRLPFNSFGKYSCLTKLLS